MSDEELREKIAALRDKYIALRGEHLCGDRVVYSVEAGKNLDPRQMLGGPIAPLNMIVGDLFDLLGVKLDKEKIYEVEALRAERDSLRATLAAAASEVARESAKREARIESLLQELDKAHAERKTSEEYGCAAREETVRLSEALDEAKRRFEQIRETAKNASRTFQSVVDRAEKAERELAGSRELLIEWVRYGYRMGMEGTDETGDADCKCLACRSSARLGRSE